MSSVTPAGTDPGYLVYLLPWAELHDELSIGPFRIWPWSPDDVGNAEVAAYLSTYLTRYVDHFGRPVESVNILVHDGYRFMPAPYQAHERPREVIDALVFSCICPQVVAAVAADNRNMGPPTADRFQLIQQNFRPGDEDVWVRVGGSTSKTRISAVQFAQPWDLGGMVGYPDSKLLSGLGRMFDPDFDAAVRERICRTLEWFRLAHTVGDGASDFSKVVMMATAFEILLSFPKRFKKRYFMCQLQACLATSETLTECRTDHQGNDISWALPACWGADFYDLRSRVVHGDPLVEGDLRYDGWRTHLIVADLVLWQCVKRELYDRHLIGEEIRECSAEWDEACPDEPAGRALPVLEGSFLGFDEVHKALGWIPST